MADLIEQLKALRAERSHRLELWRAEEDEIINALRDDGWSLGQIASALGVTKPAIQQLAGRAKRRQHGESKT